MTNATVRFEEHLERERALSAHCSNNSWKGRFPLRIPRLSGAFLLSGNLNITATSITTSGEEDPRKFAEERRFVWLLDSTSTLFLVCVSPMVTLNVKLSEDNLILYPYQVFRALANLLEIANYAIALYILPFLQGLLQHVIEDV